jgi:hypothetical protein
MIADGAVHAIAVCLGAHRRRDDRRDYSQNGTHRSHVDRPCDDARAFGSHSDYPFQPKTMLAVQRHAAEQFFA